MISYPRHDIDPAKKGEKWILQYAKAAWDDSEKRIPRTIFYRNAEEYQKIKKYVTGNQDITPYKSFLTGDDQADSSWMKIDWSVRPIVSTKRDIVISKILQRKTNITCVAIDPMAKDQADQYFADIRTKILMREALKQVNPELAETPDLQPEPGEPKDMEELEMHMVYGFKHNAAMEAEQIISLIQYQNEWQQVRREVLECLFDYGVGGYKDDITPEGKVKVRAVRPENIITSYCRKGDFSDLNHVAEVLEVSLADVAEHFDAKELEEISRVATGKDSLRYTSPNNSLVNREPEKFKVKVLDIEFYSYNDNVYRQRENSEGNFVFKKAKFDSYDPEEKVHIGGKLTNKYIKKNIKVIYKCKWIVGTDYVYDFGLATNMKRDRTKKYDTTLSYHLFAYNFHEMKAQGYMERLIPMVDEYQNTIYKIQNFKQRWLPYIIDLDLDALEGVAIGAGGEKMKPLDLLDMMWQTNVLIGRKQNMAGNPNYKSVEVRPTQMSEEFVVLVNDLGRILQEMNIVIGLNELTDSSTPNAKTLVPVANAAMDATNNALYPIIYAEKKLAESVAKGMIQRAQIAIKSGKVEGWAPALGTNTMKFIQASPDLTLHDYGIMIIDQPTDDQKMMILERMNMKEAQGLLEPEDWVMIWNCTNLKQMEMLLAYRAKKRKQEKQQEAMAMQQQNGEIQMQSAQAAEQAKRETLQIEYQLKMELEKLKIEGMIQVKQLELQARQYTDDNKTLQTAMQVESKQTETI